MIASLKQLGYESGCKYKQYISYVEKSERLKLPVFPLHPKSVCPCEQYTDYQLLPPSLSDHPAEQVTLAHFKMEDENSKGAVISRCPSQLEFSVSLFHCIPFQSRRAIIMRSSFCLGKGRVWFFSSPLLYESMSFLHSKVQS